MKALARVLLLLVAYAAVIGAWAPPVLADDEADTATATPIKHLITLMQENHSFDNYFGTYPGADGVPPGTCMPVDPTQPGGACIEPFRIGDAPVVDLGHSSPIHQAQFREGAMDGFVYAHRGSGNDGSLAMGYYDDNDLPYYWNVADNYVLFDKFFSSAAGGSVWNHMYWVAGAPGNQVEDAIPPDGFGDTPTIFDRLEESGVTWKFYVQNYDPEITFRTRGGRGDRGSQVVWVPLLAYDRYIDDPELFSHIVDISEYYRDLEQGTLPAVSYIVPSGASEHPPGSIQAGQRFVRTLITSLMRSEAWESSAFIWTYDDWGGWYDHVPPPVVDDFGYGFRVPALLVSAYAKRGYIDSTVHDYTSIMHLIEQNWGVAPVADRDANANSMIDAFDFSQPARAPILLDTEREATARPEPNRLVIYAAYAIAALLAAALVGRATGHLQRTIGALRRRWEARRA